MDITNLNPSHMMSKTAAPEAKETRTFDKLQKSFDQNCASLTQPVKHDKTSVLLLSWEKSNGNDMDVSEELDKLTECMRDEYRFTVERKELAAKNNPQLELNSVIASFVNANKDPHNLCIFYYAGHGWGGESAGRLFLTNNSSQSSREEKNREDNSVEWHSVVNLIEKTRADALVIFDCCYAGNLETFRSATNRSFETLVASRFDEPTEGPGPNSFTTALIWALGQLKGSRHGFDTKELKEKILDAPGFPKRRQTPVLFHHLRRDGEHVWIAPQPASGDELPLSPSKLQPLYRDQRPSEFLDIRFRFNKRQDEKQVGFLARELSAFARNEGSHLGICRIELNSYAPLLKDAVLRLQWQIRRERTPMASLKELKAKKTEALALKSEALDQKSEALARYQARLTMKVVLNGVLITMLLWLLFFLASNQHPL